MMKFLRGSVFLFFAAFIVGCTNQGGAGSIELDPQVLVRNCIGCHGTDLAGRSGPSLLDIKATFSEEEIVDIILNGKGKMPKVVGLNAEQAEILASWLLERE